MNKTNIKITRYEYKNFWIDIVDKEDTYEAWIQHKLYGIADEMFGVLKEQTKTEEEMIELINANLFNYIHDYVEEYCEEDTCVICGGQLDRINENVFGNNPSPVVDTGQCCDECNFSVVVPARLREYKSNK